MSVCENCGKKTPVNNKCKCSLSSIEKPTQTKTENLTITLYESKKPIVKTCLEQLTFENRGGVSLRPACFSPFNLLAINDDEIKHWAKNTIDWYYAKQKEFRLSLEGLVYFAENAIADKYSVAARDKLRKVKPILDTFVHQSIASIK